VMSCAVSSLRGSQETLDVSVAGEMSLVSDESRW
jgi:hypothetical protein